jgi:hypothetical protein
VNHKVLSSKSAVVETWGRQASNQGLLGGVFNGKVEKEFFTRSMIQNPRQCYSIAWSNTDPNTFAAGYE